MNLQLEAYTNLQQLATQFTTITQPENSLSKISAFTKTLQSSYSAFTKIREVSYTAILYSKCIHFRLFSAFTQSLQNSHSLKFSKSALQRFCTLNAVTFEYLYTSSPDITHLNHFIVTYVKLRQLAT